VDKTFFNSIMPFPPGWEDSPEKWKQLYLHDHKHYNETFKKNHKTIREQRVRIKELEAEVQKIEMLLQEK
jgi:hypothetical protein